MRPSLVSRITRPIPLNSVPAGLLRLPPKPTAQKKASATSSPTIDRLLNKFASASRPSPSRFSGLSQDGRGLGAAVPEEVESDVAQAQTVDAVNDSVQLPANLRIEQFVSRRAEYKGVKQGHRELVSSVVVLYRSCRASSGHPDAYFSACARISAFHSCNVCGGRRKGVVWSSGSSVCNIRVDQDIVALERGCGDCPTDCALARRRGCVAKQLPCTM